MGLMRSLIQMVLMMRVESCEILILMRELLVLKTMLLKLTAMTAELDVLTVKMPTLTVLPVLTAELTVLRKIRIMCLVSIEPLLQIPVETLTRLILFKLIVLTFFLLCVKQRLLRKIVQLSFVYFLWPPTLTLHRLMFCLSFEN